MSCVVHEGMSDTLLLLRFVGLSSRSLCSFSVACAADCVALKEVCDTVQCREGQRCSRTESSLFLIDRGDPLPAGVGDFPKPKEDYLIDLIL